MVGGAILLAPFETLTIEVGSNIGVTVLRMKQHVQPGICPFPVLGFWGKNTMPHAGTMAYRRYFPSTTSSRVLSEEQQNTAYLQ